MLKRCLPGLKRDVGAEARFATLNHLLITETLGSSEQSVQPLVMALAKRACGVDSVVRLSHSSDRSRS
jgi:hypothetical protein